MIRISVVIPTRNRSKDLDELLFAITRQSMPQEEYEVLVFDNGSSDRTAEVCEKYKSLISNLVYEYCESPGLHVGRNWGYLHAKSDVIVFADDDIIPEETWLKGLTTAFEDPKVVLAGGDDEPLFLADKPYWIDEFVQFSDDRNAKILALYSCITFKYNDIHDISPYYIFGCNFGVRKRLLDECGGFHPDGLPDELLCFRGDGESYVSQFVMDKEYKAVYVPQGRVKHKISRNRMSEEYVKKIAYRSAVSDAYTELRNRELKRLLFQILKKKIHGIFHGYRGIRGKYNLYYLNGLLFSVNQFICNKKCRNWVCQRDYLGENGIIK